MVGTRVRYRAFVSTDDLTSSSRHWKWGRLQRLCATGLIVAGVGGCWGTVNVVVNQNTGAEAQVRGETKADTNEQIDSEDLDFDVSTSSEGGAIDVERHASPSSNSAGAFAPASTDTDVGLGR